MEINCEFYKLLDYRCDIYEANITEKDHVIKKFKGNHESGKSHKDVQMVVFWNANVNYFPRGLEKHFPNLADLKISFCGIREITKSDLKGLEGLVSFAINSCHLTSLPDDLFTEMPNLREVNFSENEIEFASSEFLKPLLGRENVKVDLRGNKARGNKGWFWPGGGVVLGFLPITVRSLKSFEELMELIDEKYTKPIPPNIPDPVDFNPKLKEMWLTGKFSDLTIIAGDKNFKVHKAVLGMNNEVFAKIFEDQTEATEIKLPDHSSKSVEALLKFIYTNEFSKDGDEKDNFDIADKFKVAAMKTIYEKIIFEQLNDANAWETFLFSHRRKSQLLKEKAFHLIVKKIPEKVSEKLMEDPENLKKLIDTRRVYDEILAKFK